MTRDTKAHILVADDDDGHRAMLRTLLGEWGYAVDTARDGEEAVRLCRGRPFDLALLDMRMPKKTGSEALLEIRALHPALPILVMTAYSEIEAAVATIKAGAYDYLTKPLDFEKLRVTLRNALTHVTLRRENAALMENLSSALGTTDIIGGGEGMRRILDMVRTIAPSEATCLILGESGTGKELIAKAIHMNSARKKGPYVAFNCAAITDSLLESELFGHEKGAFTGADRRREGRFLQADKGTLFLDEIGEMPVQMQAKLLRVLQEREVQPVGGEKTLHVDVRIIAATNRDLAAEVAGGRFREDLYYRLNVVSLFLPPLRERIEDIPVLAQHFLTMYARRNNKRILGFTHGAMDRLIHYLWPGNVRELENTVERAVVLLLGDTVSERELPPHILAAPKVRENKEEALPPPAAQPNSAFGTAPFAGMGSAVPGQPPLGQGNFSAPAMVPGAIATLKDMERAAIMQTLAAVGGNKSEAAKRLGITRKTLHMKLHKYGEETAGGEDEETDAGEA